MLPALAPVKVFQVLDFSVLLVSLFVQALLCSVKPHLSVKGV
jgi:hypothetical protein